MDSMILHLSLKHVFIANWPILNNNWINLKAKHIDEARNFYERLVDTFPMSGRFWKMYIEHEVYILLLFAPRIKSLEDES